MKKIISTICITLFASFLIIVVGFAKETNVEPKEVYQVYLDGKKIGLIENKEKLLSLIDNESATIKEKYNVTQVYPPNGLEIKKYITYREKIESEDSLYQSIKTKRPFTINGYIVQLKSEDGSVKSINVLRKEDFLTSVNSLIHAFIPKDKYDSYINKTQKEIEEVGELLETVYFGETITIKNAFLNVEETIFTDSDELSQYLLFSTTEKQKTYVVKSGEDIETISYNNHLNVEEFLIANPDFISANQLVSPGQIVNIGLIKPMLTLGYEKHVVEDVEKFYDTEIIYDPTLSTGVRYTKQEGENGINRVTKKVIMENDIILESFEVSSSEIKPAVSKIIVRGTKGTETISDNTIWKWPTVGYSISSRYGWRHGEFHSGIDIPGKKNTPIYAASGGTVVLAKWYGNGGKSVMIDHHNGYYTEYAHLNVIYVTAGQEVARGFTIGGIGTTGRSSGNHLHFAIWSGFPHHSGSYHIDPMSKYK